VLSRASEWIRAVRPLAFTCFAVAVLAWVFRDVELARLAERLAGLGPAVLLVPLPYMGTLCCDALGWRLAFVPALPLRTVPLLFTTRIAADAVANTLPSAGVSGDAVSGWVLTARRSLPLSRIVASLAVRRVWLVLAHGLLIALGGAVVGMLRATGDLPIGFPSLEWPLFLLGGAVLLIGRSGRRALQGMALGARTCRGLERLPWLPLHRWLRRHGRALAGADRGIERVLGDETKGDPARAGFFLATIAFEAVETWMMLRLLGVELSLLEVASFDASVSCVRALAFFVPAGLGIQDVGYLYFLRAFDTPEALATAAALIVLKRASQVVWILLGYSILPLVTAPRGARAPRTRRAGVAEPLRPLTPEPTSLGGTPSTSMPS
jgi:hypothetical protein